MLSFPLGKHSGMKLLDHRVDTRVFFFYTPTNNVDECSCSISSRTFAISLSNFSCPGGCEVI